MQFSSGLRVMRAARRLSQIELVVKSGVNRDYVAKAERGEMELSQESQLAIRQALDWSPEIDALLERICASKFPVKES